MKQYCKSLMCFPSGIEYTVNDAMNCLKFDRHHLLTSLFTFFLYVHTHIVILATSSGEEKALEKSDATPMESLPEQLSQQQTKWGKHREVRTFSSPGEEGATIEASFSVSTGLSQTSKA